MPILLLILSLWASLCAFGKSPFTDLNEAEVKKVIALIRESGKFDKGIRFPVIRVQEPPKADWLAGKAAGSRLAYAAIFDFGKSVLTEVIVDLNKGTIVSTKNLPNIKPPVLLEEYQRSRALIREDKRWQAAVLKRGLKLDDVIVDMWGPGLMTKEELRPGQRIIRGLTYHKKNARNFYARPIEGILVTVDLTKNKVIEVLDAETVPLADGFKELDSKANGPLDPKLKPLKVVQSSGASFQIEDSEVTWGRWKFRLSMDPLHGLQLYHVRFKDGDKERTIIYKMSLAEMLVPYGSPGRNWSFRNAFDVGEYGLGKTLHPMFAGKDVPDNAVLLDTVIPNDLGEEPDVIKGIALYERDAGIMWKHRNSEDGDTDIRRARELVATFMTTIGNYDYGVNYIFQLDGTIKVDVQLTGILLARGTKEEKNPCADGCLPLVEKNILAPPHQHFFNFRIDFDVDGAADNYAAEVNVQVAPKDKNNPDGNVFSAKNKLLMTEREAVRDLNPATARKWKIFNSKSKNDWSHPRGYAVMPGESAVPYLHPTSQIRRRAQFIEHPIWVTAYHDDEMSGAAPFPTTAPPGQGLPKYISNNEKLGGKDLVLWYTFGVTHIPRPEEWPIMSVHHTGFTLMPMNFFSQNPAMTLPE